MLETIKSKPQKTKLNSSRVYLEEWLKKAAQSLGPDSLVLDAGAGISPYGTLFSNSKYESADFCQVDKAYAVASYVCDLKSIPVEDNRYDMVVCTQVLEHVSDPQAVLKELYRILKPNAELWISAPLFYEEHEIPYDYYRYTQFGFRHLIETAGFKINSMEWLEGYYGTLSYQLETAAKYLPSNPKYYGEGLTGILSSMIVLVLKKVFSLSAILFANLDIKYKNVSTGYCKNYAVIAIKEA